MDTELPRLPRLPMGKPSNRLNFLATRLPPAFIIRMGFWMRRFLLQLADRIVPPSLPLFEKSTGMMETVMLSIVSRYEIADLLIKGGETADALAKQCGINPDVLHRILRALVSRGVFRLHSDGRFCNNRLSLSLTKGTATANREWAQYFGSQSNMMAWINLLGCVENAAPPFDSAFGMHVWSWFEQHPDEQEMFAHSMMGVTALQAPIIAKLYPFQDVKTVCDIGGGRGTLIAELLNRHHHLKGILCDAIGVLQSADVLLKERGVRDRVETIETNFLERIPEGDAYILKNIFHDWDDDFCSKVLQTLKKTIRPGQKLLIIEHLVEKNETLGVGPISDMQMMVVCSGGRERSLSEIQGLLRKNGFECGRVFTHPIVGIVEGYVNQ